MRKKYKVIIVVFLGVFSVWLFSQKMQSNDITITHFHVICRRISDYKAVYGELPSDLEILSRIKGKGSVTDEWSNEINYDGWGNEYQYSTLEDGGIRLVSLGADRKPGGKGLDADIIVTYDPNDEFLYPSNIIIEEDN